MDIDGSESSNLLKEIINKKTVFVNSILLTLNLQKLVLLHYFHLPIK